MMKVIFGKFLDFKMVYSRNVIRKIQKLKLILHDIHIEGMSLSKSF
jgi:hypothetical protein